MPRGKNPRSLANLKPIKKGEVRNPAGINRKRPYSETLSRRLSHFAPVACGLPAFHAERRRDLFKAPPAFFPFFPI
jgi:hypothetical protein